MDYYVVKGPDSEEQHLIQTEDIEPSKTEEFLKTLKKGIPGNVMHGAGAANRPNPGTREYGYRKMGEAEFKKTLKEQALQPNINKPDTNEMWITETLDHTRNFQNKGVTGPEVVAEFEIQKTGYQNIRDAAIPQHGSKAEQLRRAAAGEGKANLYHYEQLPKEGPHRNLGVKGQENVEQFNKAVISVKKTNPHSVMNKNQFTRWIRRNKIAVAGHALAVIADGITLTLALIDDKGEYGNSTKLAIGEIVGGMIVAEIGTYLAGVISSAVFGSAMCPGVGTIIGIVCGMIGSLIGHGIASFFLTVDWHGEGPGAPIMDTDPYTQPKPSMGLQTGAQGVPSMGLNTGATGVPSMGLTTGATGFPQGNYMTRRDFDNMHG